MFGTLNQKRSGVLGMGNEEWDSGNRKCRMVFWEWEMLNGILEMGNAEWDSGNGRC